MNVNLPKEYVDRLREKAKNGTLTDDEQMLLVGIIAGESEEPVKEKPKAEPVKERKVVTAPAEVHTVATELTNDDIAMLRMKAKRNELTDDERMIYAEYLRMMQARGDWYPGKDAYDSYQRSGKNGNNSSYTKSWSRNMWESFLIALPISLLLYFPVLFVGFSFMGEPSVVPPLFESIFEPSNGGVPTIEDIGEPTNDDSSWSDFFDWGSFDSQNGGAQTIEDLGNGTILISE